MISTGNQLQRAPTITPNNSWHPDEHKAVAMTHLISRMNLNPLSKDSKNREVLTIQTILHHNNYRPNTAEIFK
jgi:hypothetical protein